MYVLKKINFRCSFVPSAFLVFLTFLAFFVTHRSLLTFLTITFLSKDFSFWLSQLNLALFDVLQSTSIPVMILHYFWFHSCFAHLWALFVLCSVLFVFEIFFHKTFKINNRIKSQSLVGNERFVRNQARKRTHQATEGLIFCLLNSEAIIANKRVKRLFAWRKSKNLHRALS